MREYSKYIFYLFLKYFPSKIRGVFYRKNKLDSFNMSATHTLSGRLVYRRNQKTPDTLQTDLSAPTGPKFPYKRFCHGRD